MRILIFLSVFFVVACQHLTMADAAKTFEGFNSDTLLTHASWGVPQKQAELNSGGEVWTYYKSQSHSLMVPTSTTGMVGGQPVTMNSTKVQQYSQECVINFVVREGIVTSSSSNC